MNEYAGTHKSRVKHFSVMATIFLPLGIVLLCFAALGLGLGIPMYTGAITALAGETGGSAATEVQYGFTIVGGLVLIALGIVSLVFGVPIFILNFVFRTIAKSSRMEDEARGVDYTGFPFGK